MQAIRSNAIIQCIYPQVLQNHHPYAHWVGSARMGKSIEDSVLDENTKVHGVHDLYVAGAGFSSRI